ncbi:pilus assembly protein [Stappia sp. F7233]|uniref:Pilus assembly protein n=1 Tax=Stappia albiluteola TaxID=2758565 RepID=A0A839ABF8_9HYPH|nr:TadE/TadG family type IV pilus assembly protein [Stappia albiluteola]MBA5776237.1 pilus assembly protein [Stappia albiluteola]
MSPIPPPGEEKQQSRLVRLLSRFRADRRGVTMIEFAFVGGPFLLLLFSILEVGISFFVNQVIDNAMLTTARLIRTGQAQLQGFDAAKFKTEILKNAAGFPLSNERLYVDVEKLNNFAAFTPKPLIDENGNVKDDFGYDDGEAGDIIIVRVLYRWPMVTNWLRLNYADLASGDRLLTSVAIFRNEPFPWKSKGS